MQLLKYRQIPVDRVFFNTDPQHKPVDAACRSLSPRERSLITLVLPSERLQTIKALLLSIRLLLFGLPLALTLAQPTFGHDAASLFPKQDMTDRVELADGFRLLKLAGNAQVPNAFCMTLHSSGDLIVSGPGYLRRLRISTKGLERVTDLPHPPSAGAQGLWCDGDDLLFVGGEGLCRIKGALSDLPGDELATLPKPEVLLKIDVGKEHQAHAIRKGSQKWWYLICGNDTKLDPKFSSHKDSPVKDPAAGCLLRFDFELEEYQVFAHGFRNAYDFDFGPDGSVYVYDSDGERDISLPWYRPTRVFRVEAGDHAGWVNKSWKRPSYYSDMPTEIAALGRGSPTGVCYNGGNKMGKLFSDALFVGDWTFGRINAIDVADSKKLLVDLLLSKGQFGFAVTDLVIGGDGLLYVTVGGRGTEGGLFRIEPNPVAVDELLSGMTQAASSGLQKRSANVATQENSTIDVIREFQLNLGGCGGSGGMMAGYSPKQRVLPKPSRVEESEIQRARRGLQESHRRSPQAVSYTHLTLPTKRIV